MDKELTLQKADFSGPRSHRAVLRGIVATVMLLLVPFAAACSSHDCSQLVPARYVCVRLPLNGTFSANITGPSKIPFGTPFSDRIEVKNDGAAPVEVSIEASLPKGASAVCKLVEAEVSANDGALGPSKWLLLTADPPAQVDGVTGPLLELTWIFSTDSYGDCDVQALVKDENSGQSMLLEKLTHIIPEVNATAVNLGGLIATDRGLTKWDEVDQTAPPAIPEIDMHMKGSVLIFSAVGTVQTAALGKKDYGHFEISPTVTAKALELLDPECKVVDACSVDAFLDLRTNTPKPVHLMTLSSVNSGDTISVCLKGDYMDGSSSDDHKELCVIVHGINDSTLNAVAGPDYLVGIPVPHV